MTVVSSLVTLLSILAPIMTAPTYANCILVASGWVFASGRRTVTEVIQRAGAVGDKHYTVFHRFFSRARWSMDDVSRVLLGVLLKFIPEGQVVSLAIDDTLCRKRGLHIFGTAMHHDPLISCRKVKLVNWGHNWVVVGIVLSFPFAPRVAWCLPFAFRLYISKKRPRSQRWEGRPKNHKTRPELAMEILQQIASWYPDRRFQVLCDSAYGGKSVLKPLPQGFDVISRLPMNAQLFARPPRTSGKGRPRKKGRRLPAPQKVAANPRQACKKLRLRIYGKKKTLHVKEITALWPSAGYRSIKILVVRDPSGKVPDQAFFSTNADLSATEILEAYARRWSIEVAFQNSKSHFGFEDPQNRTRNAVERTAPFGLVLYSFVIVWFAQHGHSKCKFPNRPWYKKKATAAFVDIVATLRRESLREHFLNTPEWTQGNRKILRQLMDSLALAA